LELNGSEATIRRPNLVGALLGKVATVTKIPSQTAPERAKHRQDADALAKLPESVKWWLLGRRVMIVMTSDDSEGGGGVGVSRSVAPGPFRYHDVMTRKATTVRLPEDLADTADVVARARGVSVNQVILDALQSEVDRVRKDEEFMTLLHSLVERDKEILDRLAE